MPRSTYSKMRRLALSALMMFVGSLGGAACGAGGGQEGEIIRSFFRASRVDDRQTLGNISMVSFDARVEGTVNDFDIDTVGEETRRTLRMVELSDALREARAAEQGHASEMKEYQDANLEAIARVIQAERADETLTGDDLEVQEMWTQFRAQSSQHSAEVSAADQALSEESRVASRSAFNPNNPFDVRGYEGVLTSKDVSITARVNRDDATEERAMVITLERVELGSGEDMIEGRWVISAIE